MTDINDLVQEFKFSTSSDEASLFAMRRLLGILQTCSDEFNVCFDIVALQVCDYSIDLADKNLQTFMMWRVFHQAKFNILDEYRKMVDQSHSYSTSKDLGDMLMFLPGVVVQKHMSIQGMADLYRIKPELLERLIKFFFEPPETSPSHYILDNYLSGFLQDRDRSKQYYCDPISQHISVCRHFLSFLDGSNALYYQS